jgi:diadenosine tetraphosphate (Ap4A) HIT family hydrolase
VLLQKAMAILKKNGAEHVYFFRINDLVNHFHFHVVPRYPGTPKEFWGLKIIEWPEYPQADLTEIVELTKEFQKFLYR